MPLETVNFFGNEGAKRGGSNFTPTQDELRTIHERMQDPKFVELFRDYMQSMQDPETRREEEAYLEQVEREAKEGGDYSFDFIFPRPGFVVELLETSTSYRLTAPQGKSTGESGKGKDSGKQMPRVFVNMCSSDKVDPFTEEASGKSQDSNWNVPISISKPRTEMFTDAEQKKAEEAVVVYDAVFHPKTLQLADLSNRFCCFLVNIAVEHINTGYGDRHGFKFRRLSSHVTAIGTPQNQTIRKKNGESPFAPVKDAPVLTHPTQVLPPALATASKHHGSTAAQRVGKKENMPHCTITHRGRIDLTSAWGWKVVDDRVGVPEELVVKVELPAIRSVADLNVEVEDTYVQITQSDAHPYHGTLILPFSVEPTPLEAKFDRRKGALTLLLRVVPPAPTGLTARDMREQLASGGNDANEDKGTMEVGRQKNPEEGMPAVTTTMAPLSVVPDTNQVKAVEEEVHGHMVETSAKEKENVDVHAKKTTEPQPIDKQASEATQETPKATEEKGTETKEDASPKLSCIADQDRAQRMLAKVREARLERERAAAEAEAEAEADKAAANTQNPPSSETPPTVIPTPMEAALPSSSSDAPLHSHSDPIALEELRKQQEVWRLAVQQRSDERDATERETAEREMRREAERARRQAETARLQEVAEAKQRERMAELPLENKYIFTID